MIVFPNSKINLGLNIISKRDDGYHNIETVFYPIEFFDALEVISNHDRKNEQEDSIAISGQVMDITPNDNLCSRALRLIKKDYPGLPSVKLHLHKNIPTGAGLGGGSADAAFTLKLLNEKFQLNIPSEKLLEYALQLGSDCPFFVVNKPCFAGGRGEILEKIQIDLANYRIVLVLPQIHVSTVWAFSQVKPAETSGQLKKIIKQPAETWKSVLTNDFEEAVFFEYPELRSIKENLYHSGAVYASLSGSGSAIYGIFKGDAQPVLKFPGNCIIKYLPGKAQ